MGEAPPISTLPPGADRITEPTAFSNRKIEFHLARKPFNGFNSTADKGGFQLETLNSSSVPANPRGLEVQKAKSELVENHGMDPELLSFRIHFRKIGAGLANLGNTCFLNSVLQCLTYTEPLAAYLQSGKHQNSCRTAGFCALCAIQKHVSRALNSTGRIVAPKDLVSNLRCISRSFRNARQEDAHEYMVNLLESMHKCCLPSGIPSESPTAYERSLVHKIFGGRLRSQVKCTQCSYSSNKFDPFLDLSLEINKADSLYKALNHFTAKEELDGGEKQYQCQQCKQKVRASKQLTIHKPPHVLAIHLKRFGSHIQGHKIDKKVSFSPNLDLKPFVTGTDDVDLKYTLYGVLVHAGWSTHSGHYYSFVRTSTGMWYSLDDNRVVQVNERKVLEQKAYMLFYVRDARIPAPKKALEVGQKGNMVTSAIGNKSALNFNMGKSNVLGSRAVDASNVLPKKVIPVSDDVATKEVMQTGPTEKKLIVPCSQVVTEVDGSNGSVSVENKAISMSSNGQVACVKGVECLIEKTALVIPQLDPKEDKSESCNGVVDVKNPVMNTLDTPLSGASEQVVVSVSTDSQKNDTEEKSSVTVENGGVLPESINTNSEVKIGEIAKLKISLEKKSVDKKGHLGVKKKQLFKMQLSTKIIFGKKFRIPKRKIHKKNPEQEHVSNGPSSSSESSSKKLSNGLKRKNCENIVVTESGELNKRIDKEFRERVEKKPDMSHSFVEKRKDGNTKGCLEDTAVPQWDDVKLPTNGVFEESTGAQSSLTIGYVADEWDEEYDRGKRKKVRTNKVEFGGPNLFQEIATKKAKRKGAKLNSNSRNEPYRI